MDGAEAERKGLTAEAFAEQTATTWRQGLAQWGQGADRVARLQAAVETHIYVPGEQTVRPLCGTWFLGRLQTAQDKARVLEGLDGASVGD